MRIAVYDPDNQLTTNLRYILAEQGHTVVVLSDFNGLVDQVIQYGARLVLIEGNANGAHPEWVMQDLRVRGYQGQIIYITREGDVQQHRTSMVTDCGNG
jgi:DNA-binding response OmpR family regulator